MYMRHDSHFNLIKAFLSKDPFYYSPYDLSEAEVIEIFTSPRLKETAPERFPVDFKRLQMLGDAALDLHILTLLRERNFAGSFEDEKKRLVGNGADQPLNQLFDRLGLKEFILGFEDPLSPHQKADVVEALFGFLHQKEKLTPALIAKLFESFLPTPIPRPAAPRALFERETLPTVADLIAKDPCFLAAIIKIRPDHILSLSQALIEEILRVMIEKPQSESGPLVKRLKLLISFNSSIWDLFFRAALHQDAFSPEKFIALFPKATPDALRLAPRMDLASPTLLLKLSHYAITETSRMETACHCLQRVQNPREKPEDFVHLFHEVTKELHGFESLIPEFEKLTPERQALFPKFNEAFQLWLPNKANVAKLLRLEVASFEKVISAFGVKNNLANVLRGEIERRLGNSRVSEKTRRLYQPYMDCLSLKEVAAEAKAVPPPAGAHAFRGGAGGGSGDRVLNLH